MGVPVGELQYGTVLDGHVRPRRTVIGRRLGLRQKKNFFCHAQKRDYLSRVSQRARGATKKEASYKKQKKLIDKENKHTN